MKDSKVIVMLGVPGSGKGTQAELLAKELKIPHVSTGDLIRQEIKNETPLGLALKEEIDKGGLSPDATVGKIIKQRIQQEDCAHGMILDGMPRTINQANHLNDILMDHELTVSCVLYIHLDHDDMLKRLRGRWSCQESDHTYHEIFKPPQTQGICDIDGSTLYQREDQKEEAIQERIKKYNQSTAPLIEFYRKQNLLIDINGEQSIEQVFADTLSQLKTQWYNFDMVTSPAQQKAKNLLLLLNDHAILQTQYD
ncbi:adenylate kinase, partial [Patescibacteria group bacterium]|nr:adenylate kinase [Patescibacteria group bacterium]